MTQPETFKHALFHVIKYAGEAAAIAEKLEHAESVEEAKDLARVFLDRRPEHMRISFQALCQHLEALIDDGLVQASA